jgi:hypothetical protein
MNYWEECIRESFDDCGIVATEEQIKTVASWVDGAHENYSMATGEDVASANFVSDEERELKMLKKAIENKKQWELSTSPCITCNTTGMVTDGWGRDIKCEYCRGKGRV